MTECPQCRKRGDTINNLQRLLREKNEKLDALHYVWCSGGCEGGVHRFSDEELTPEIVAEAIRNTDRMVKWFVARAGRDFYEPRRKSDGSLGCTMEEIEEAWKQAKARLCDALRERLEEQDAEIDDLKRRLADAQNIIRRAGCELERAEE